MKSPLKSLTTGITSTPIPLSHLPHLPQPPPKHPQHLHRRKRTNIGRGRTQRTPGTAAARPTHLRTRTILILGARLCRVAEKILHAYCPPVRVRHAVAFPCGTARRVRDGVECSALLSGVAALVWRHRNRRNDCHDGCGRRGDYRGDAPAGAGGLVAHGAGAGASVCGNRDGGYGYLARFEGDGVALVWGDGSHGLVDCCGAVGEVSVGALTICIWPRG